MYFFSEAVVVVHCYSKGSPVTVHQLQAIFTGFLVVHSTQRHWCIIPSRYLQLTQFIFHLDSVALHHLLIPIRIMNGMSHLLPGVNFHPYQMMPMIIIIYINNKSYFFPGITSKGGLSWTRIHALPKLRDLTEFLQSNFPLLDSLHDQIAVIYFYYISLNFKFFNNIHAFKHFILLRSYNLKSKHRVF